MDTKSNKNKILIVGAGIAGLALAIMCEKRGIDYELIERNSVSRPQGYSVTLPPGGLDALQTLGVYDVIVPNSVPVEGVLLASSESGVARTIDFGRSRLQVRTMRRADLHAALLAALTHPIRYNTSVARLHESRHGADVQFETGETESYSLVVGADGLRSHIRTHMSPTALPSPTGVAFWTFFIPPHLYKRFSTTHITQYWQQGNFAGIFPLPDGASIVLSTHLSPTTNLRKVDVRAQYAGMSHDIDTILATASLDMAYSGHLYEVKLVHWQQYPYVVIGDAAHAMMPATGMGSTAGILDAIALSDALVGDTNIRAALKTYEADRTMSSKRAQVTSRLITEAMLSTGLAGTINQKAARVLPDSFFVRVFR